MTEHPDTREEWQALFDAYFPEGSGVLVTMLGVPDEPQMVGWRVFILDFEDGAPTVVMQDVYTDYPLHFHIESVEAEVPDHVLLVKGSRPGNPGDATLRLSNRIPDDQRNFMAARQEHGV
jgi:hypothetical protein